MFLTVFVDLIVAVGIGVFIANVITIEKLSASQSKNIRAISDMDDKLPLTREQKRLLNMGEGRILFFYLSGAMIFGVSKALARERASIPDHDVVIIDLSDVSMLDDTISLSIENVVQEAKELEKAVYVVLKTRTATEKLKRMGVEELLDDGSFVTDRTVALENAIKHLNQK